MEDIKEKNNEEINLNNKKDEKKAELNDIILGDNYNNLYDNRKEPDNQNKEENLKDENFERY